MKIRKVIINKKEYLYASDSIYIAQGKTIQKQKSLGREKNKHGTYEKMREFAAHILTEETKLREQYWQRHISDNAFTAYIKIKKLEENRTLLYRFKKNLTDTEREMMEGAFLIDFIYNSNKIEGSKIPKKSVEEGVRRRTKNKNEEVENTIRAIEFTNNAFTFNLQKIKKLHANLLAHEPHKRGFRKETVMVGMESVTHWKDIKKEMKELLNWYENNKKKIYPPELAFTFYYRFERIHPFIDGNGRIGRILMNKILKENRYHPIIIWNKRRKAHFSAFKHHIHGKKERYFRFMSEQLVKTYQIYTEKTNEAFEIDKQKEKNFFAPSPYNFN